MAKRGGFPGGGMPGNMANLMKQAQREHKILQRMLYTDGSGTVSDLQQQ